MIDVDLLSERGFSIPETECGVAGSSPDNEDPRVNLYHDRRRLFEGFDPEILQIPGAFYDFYSVVDIIRWFKTIDQVNLIDPYFAEEHDIKNVIEYPPHRQDAFYPKKKDPRAFEIFFESASPESLADGKPYIARASCMVKPITLALYPTRYEDYEPDDKADLTFVKEFNAGRRGLYPKIVDGMEDKGLILVVSFEPEYHGPSPRQLPPDDIGGQLEYVGSLNTSHPAHKSHFYFIDWSDMAVFRVNKKSK